MPAVTPQKTKPITFSGSCSGTSTPSESKDTVHFSMQSLSNELQRFPPEKSHSVSSPIDRLPNELHGLIAKALFQQAPGNTAHDLYGLSRVSKHWNDIVHSEPTKLDYSILKSIQAAWNPKRPITENPIQLFPFLPKAKRLRALDTLRTPL